MKRLRADDSMRSYAKVGHRQVPKNNKARLVRALLFVFPESDPPVSLAPQGVTPVPV